MRKPTTAPKTIIEESSDMMMMMDPIHIMLQQEKGSYAYCTDSVVLNQHRINNADRLNVKWREKICQWSYNVVDQ